MTAINKGKRFLGSLRSIDPERRRQIYDSIVEASTPTQTFYIMVAISTTIAAYGLLANSAAVVIGAMLVAPLMGPIFGIALGLSVGDHLLLRRSCLSEALGTVIAVMLGVLIGIVPLRLGFGSEIIARTQPTLYDIIVGVAAGLAGAYAVADERISPALPGVAISTSLVPPLATCGLAISTGRWDWAFGAFLLFFSNFLAIELAAAIVFTALGMAELRLQEALTFVRFLHRFGLSLTALIVVALFMTHTLLKLIADYNLSSTIETTLARELRTAAGANLSNLNVDNRDDGLDVIATVLTPREFEPPQVSKIEAALRKEVDHRVHLVIRSVISRDADRNGPVFLASKDRERREEIAKQTDFLQKASQILHVQLAQVPGARLIDVYRDVVQGRTTVTAVVRSPTAIEPAAVAKIQEVLNRGIGIPVGLVVRSVLTRDADAQRYVYDPEKDENKPLTGEAVKLHNQIEAALTRELKRSVPDASLVDLQHVERNGRLEILAVVRTPWQIAPAKVKQIELALRRSENARADLVIRSIIGLDASATKYFSVSEGSPPGASETRE